jgi:hypothetical protein
MVKCRQIRRPGQLRGVALARIMDHMPGAGRSVRSGLRANSRITMRVLDGASSASPLATIRTAATS